MIIKEFLPNPVGSDKDGEYIILLNDSQAAVFLDGWKLRDAAGKEFFLKGSLGAGQELKLFYVETKISLNNNGERLQLFDVAVNLKDELSYSGQAEEGQLIAKSEKGKATSELATSKEVENGYPINAEITNFQLPITEALFVGF